MLGFNWNNLTKEFRGISIMFGGIILLLHTLNILQKWLTWFLIFASLAMIVYGFIEAGLWKKVEKITKKEDIESPPPH